ncbi:MAG: helix-turn-helix transcriptional regulator, partial [Spirochaetales bacterium]|nr:helix-turn-helix transcriptional regulator [Spirochaetales bacterium]
QTLLETKLVFISFFEESFNNINADSTRKIFEKILHHLEKDYTNKNLCVDTISTTLNMQKRKVTLIFKKYSNCSIAEYLNDFRMEKTKELLETTDFYIDQIADKVGIDNSNYMYSLFKKKFGITPREFSMKIKKLQQKEALLS